MRLSRCCTVTVVAAAIALVCAAPAFAGPGLRIRFANALSPSSNVSVALVATGDRDCWFDNDLGRTAEQNAVAPGKVAAYYTEKEANFFNSCGKGSGTRGLVLKVKEPGRDWSVPAGEPADWHMYFKAAPATTPDWGFQFRNGLTSWLPLKDGAGLICWQTQVKNVIAAGGSTLHESSGYAEIVVYGDHHCNTLRKANAVSDDPVAVGSAATDGRTAPAATAAQSGSDHAVIDVLSTIGVLCPWWAYPGETDRCNRYDAGDEAKWTIDNVDNVVRGLKITSSNAIDEPKTSVATAQLSIPPGQGAGTLAVNESVATQSTTSTSTQHGGKAGAKFGFKQAGEIGLPFLAAGKVEFTQEISGEYNYATTKTETTSRTATRQVQISYAAQPGFTSMLDVFTSKRSATYNYDADLDFGKDGAVQPISSPGNVALNQSPALRQPCIGYMVGGKDTRNSIMNSGQQLLNAGNAPDEPTLSPERRTFLRSLPFWRTSGSACPGFPAGYSTVAGFKGSGVGTYANLGYDATGKPVSVMTACVCVTPFGPRPAGLRAEAQAAAAPRQGSGGGPCQQVPVPQARTRSALQAGTLQGVTPGVLEDARADPAGSTVEGGATSDKIIGPDAGGTIDAGDGAFDIVNAGAGDTVINGGPGDDLLNGGPGDDTIVGGSGADTIHGGAGDDHITDPDRADVLADAGDDTIEGRSLDGVIDGGPGNDTVILTGDASRAGVRDPSGDTTIELIGSGTPTITIPPTAGVTTVRTDHTLRAALYVDALIATGDAPVALAGTEGTTTMVGNDAPNLLKAGIATTTLNGNGGDDEIQMGEDNDDTATGGPGADRFQSSGMPQRGPRGARARPATRRANTITDFTPAEGDRIVLRAPVYGDAATDLARRFKAWSGRNPRPRTTGATLLFDTRDHILSFDADGTGPIADKVVARLPNQTRAARDWIVVRRR